MSGGTLLLDRRRLASLRPLLPDRSPAEWHAALVAEITAGLGAAHAAVLAVPVAEGEELAWYAPGSRSRVFSALLVADRRALTEALGAILSDIRRLGESGAAPAVAAAWPSLREVPDLDAVFAVDGRPVLTAWAQMNARAERPAGLLARFDDGLAWQPPPRFPTRAWALAGGALAALALAAGVLLPLAGAALFPPVPQCTIDPASLAIYQEASREAERQDALEGELARLEEERGRRRLACPLPVAPPPPPPAPPERRAEAPPPPPPPQRPPRREEPPRPPPGTQPCDVDTQSGGAGETRTRHFLGPTPGPVTLDYNTLREADMIEVRYRGRVVASTPGMVRFVGRIGFDWRPQPGDYVVEVVVIGPSASTRWRYRLNCPVR
ncbi:hypothetical protein GCM10011504_18160 [Siccirubricoccus deserti]|uniref:Uncharacterized protein n=1 Tax=Siccirubricoccus deserti TaxID=2013562 RepID=A0A9X0UDV7_9PROT|nr:hypothetical protein [Siccirubricoccus deserti]MBC4016033.1 hypothetical protein [Siccirubricoccus deserti]GGC40113.1 hypothetical protein GCM10011504_18160 [Siccirubricoccus deserti]